MREPDERRVTERPRVQVSKLARAMLEAAVRWPGVLAAELATAIPDTCIVTLVLDAKRDSTVFDRDRSIIHQLAGRELGITDAYTVFEPALELEKLRMRHRDLDTELLRAIGARGMIAVPLRAGEDRAGLLVVIRHRADQPPLDEHDLEVVQDLALHAGLAIDNARLREHLEDEVAARIAAERAFHHGEQLRLADDRSVEATLFLDAIVENIPDMVFVKDATQLAFVRFNRAGEKLLGIHREDLIGKTDHDFFPPDEAAFFIQKDRETLESKGLIEILEEPIQTANGLRYLHTKKVSLLDAQGTPRYLLGISHDITERKRAEARLRAAKDNAETASRELEDFASRVADDLRAPLRRIVGFSEALLEDCLAQLDEQGRSHLHRLSESANRMAALIDDLLGLARVSREELNRERVDLSALAYTTATSLQRANPERRAEVVIAPSLVVDADRRLLAIVLDNLFSNAWKFTAKSVQTRVELGSMKRDDRTVYFVRDSGAGFDMAYADKLFSVFQRLHSDAEFPGTGIGLATVARIIRRHHGHVWADGVVGEGATFYFTLGEREL